MKYKYRTWRTKSLSCLFCFDIYTVAGDFFVILEPSQNVLTLWKKYYQKEAPDCFHTNWGLLYWPPVDPRKYYRLLTKFDWMIGLSLTGRQRPLSSFLHVEIVSDQVRVQTRRRVGFKPGWSGFKHCCRYLVNGGKKIVEIDAEIMIDWCNFHSIWKINWNWYFIRAKLF